MNKFKVYANSAKIMLYEPSFYTKYSSDDNLMNISRKIK